MADEVHRTGAGNDPAAKPVCGTPRAERRAEALAFFHRWGKVMRRGQAARLPHMRERGPAGLQDGQARGTPLNCTGNRRSSACWNDKRKQNKPTTVSSQGRKLRAARNLPIEISQEIARNL